MTFLRAAFAGLVLLSSIPADASPFRAKRFRSSAFAEPPQVAPPLTPGTTPIGEWAQSAQPADVGGSTRQVIANWYDPPFQDRDSSFYLRVVAYQAPTSAQYAGGTKNAIASVDFACDGGEWATVTTPTTVDGHSIYQIGPIDPASFTGDGQHECRFRANPVSGRALVGQGSNVSYNAIVYSMYLNTNEGDTLVPYQRIVDANGGVDNGSCGGGTGASACATVIQAKTNIYTAKGDLGGHRVCLMPGDYSWGTTGVSPTVRPAATRWLLINPCDGVSQSQVRFTSAPVVSGATRGIGVAKYHVKDVLATVGLGPTTNAGSISGDSVPGTEYGWADNVDTTGTANNTGSIMGATRAKAVFVTDSTATDVGTVANYATLVRDVVADNIQGDAISNARTVIGFTITNLDIGIYAPYGEYCISIGQGSNANCGNHTDMYQINRNTTNLILTDVVGVSGFVQAQWLLSNNYSLTNAALVNVRANNQDPTSNPGNQLFNLREPGTYTNLFLLNGSIEGGSVTVDVGFSDVTWVDTTCASQSGWTAGNQAGITFLGSSTCDVP